MQDRDLERMPELITSLSVRAVEEKRFHDALLTGFAFYLISCKIDNEECKNTALATIEGALDRLLPERVAKDHECAFCGRISPKDRLVAGPNVFICSSCVSMAGEIISETRPD